MFHELTPDEAGHLDGALFGGLHTMNTVNAAGPDYDAVWGETADVLDDLRAQHARMSNAHFRLSQL